MNDFSKPTSTRRDELAREIHGTQQLGCGCCTDYDYTQEQDKHADKLDVNSRAVAIADHLLAAGWTKPRTITTAEELDALPTSTVIRAANGEVFERQADGPYYDGPHDWQGFEGTYWNGETFVLPATVLWEPAP